MSQEPQPKEKKKKARKRVKAIHAKIKEQMEFYFSDSNLHKDRFLKKAIEATTDGYIELSTFLKFNRIGALTDEIKVVADAIAYKSDLLKLNDDRTKVKRTKPLSEPKDIDERTVYVEYLPSTADHDWLRKVFMVCGKVSYVSLPRYQTTGDLKGFGFVEFETEEGAKKACEELNNPPVEAGPRIGMFPKSSKPLEALKKKLPEDQIHETEEKVRMEFQTETEDVIDSKESENSETVKSEETSEITGGILVKRVKRRRTKSEGSVDESFSDSSPQKRKKHEVSFDLPEDNDKGASGGKKKSKKRKNRSKTVDVVSSHDPEKTESDKSDIVEQIKTDKTETEDVSDMLAKRKKEDKESSKRKADSDADSIPERKKLNLDSEKDNQSKDSDSMVNRKRKLDSKLEDDSKDGDERSQKKRRRQSSRESSVSQSDSESDKKGETQSTAAVESTGVVGDDEGKKKKNRRRRKQHKNKEVPELRVIPKTEWLCLREEYLKLQKASMAMLKRTLAEMKDRTNTSENVSVCALQNHSAPQEEKKKRREIKYIPDVIVKVVSEKPMLRKSLKSDLGSGISIAYIDVKDGLDEGHIRCEDSESAKRICSQKLEGYNFSLVTGSEEKLYWDKLVADREGKLNSKSRHKKRGQEKWMEKAQKASLENVERKHIIFDED